MLKKLLLVLFVLLLLGAAGVWLALRNADALLARYKPLVEAQASEALGLPVTFGQAHLSVWPRVAVEVEAVAAGRAREVTAERVILMLELLPLLSRRIEVTTLEVSRPVVRLVRSGAGIRVPGAALTPVPRAPAGEAADGEVDKGVPLDLSFRSLVVTGGEVALSDELTGDQWKLSQMELRTALAISPELINLEEYSTAGELAGAGSFRFAGRDLRFRPESGLLDIPTLEVVLNGAALAVSGAVETKAGEGTLRLSGTGVRSEALLQFARPFLTGELVTTIDGIALSGRLSPNLAVMWNNRGVTVSGKTGVAGVQGTPFGVTIADLRAEATVRIQPEGGRLEVVGLSARTGERGEVITGGGEFELAPFGGKVELSTAGLSWDNLRGVAARFVDVGSIPLTAGQIGGKVELTFGSTTPLSGGGEFTVTGVAGERAGVTFRDGAGSLRWSHRDGRSTIRIGGLKLLAGTPPAAVDLAGSVTVPGTIGELVVKAPALQLSTLQPLIGPASLPAKGELGTELTIRLNGAQVSAAGFVDLRQGELVAGPHRLTGISGRIRLAGSAAAQTIGSDNLAVTVNGAPLTVKSDVRVRAGQAEFPSLSVRGLGGDLTGSGAIGFGASRALAVKVNGRSLEVATLMRAIGAGEGQALTGQLKSVAVDLRGRSTDDLIRTLQGSVSFRLENGLLRGVNIGRVVLEKLQGIPLLGAGLAASIPPEFGRYLRGEDTSIRVLTAAAALESGTVRAQELKLLSDFYAVDAKGQYSFDRGADLRATVFFDQEFSLSLARRIPEVRRLFGREQTLVVPVAISGPPTALRVLPDLGELTRRAAQGELESQAGRLLEGVLGGRRQGAPPPAPGAQATPPPRGGGVGDVFRDLLRR